MNTELQPAGVNPPPALSRGYSAQMAEAMALATANPDRWVTVECGERTKAGNAARQLRGEGFDATSRGSVLWLRAVEVD